MVSKKTWLFVIGASLGLWLLIGIDVAKADTIPPPYELDVNAARVWEGLTSGETGSGKWFVVRPPAPLELPYQFGAQAAIVEGDSAALAEIAVDAPALLNTQWLLPGVGYFVLGYTIGTVVDHVFLHMQTRIAGPPGGVGTWHVDAVKWEACTAGGDCLGIGDPHPCPWYMEHFLTNDQVGRVSWNVSDPFASAIAQAVAEGDTLTSWNQKRYVWRTKAQMINPATAEVTTVQISPAPNINGGLITQPLPNSDTWTRVKTQIHAHPDLEQAINHDLDPVHYPDPRAPGQGPKFHMPDCAGLSQAVCTANIVAMNGHAITIELDPLTWQEAELELQPETVVRTVPEIGTELDLGLDHQISLIVNPAPEEMPIRVPEKATPTVTFDDYIATLPNGWPTNRTNLDTDTGDPETAPNTVVKITPQPGTRIGPNTPITITTNPPDWPFPVSLPPGGGGCNCGGIDFGPLSSVNYGEKFPFGVFTWVQTTFGGMNGEIAPTATLTKPAGMGGGTTTIRFGSSEWESARGPIWLVFEFFLTLFAVWFMATRVIGFGGGD